ncbi:hypothetical protein LZ30DRAFT_245655 [Colletotrichum cereale]|nr:hypothetical protein LZ30DRAFT_245655 [Colletotrichum cereale]
MSLVDKLSRHLSNVTSARRPRSPLFSKPPHDHPSPPFSPDTSSKPSRHQVATPFAPPIILSWGIKLATKVWPRIPMPRRGGGESMRDIVDNLLAMPRFESVLRQSWGAGPVRVRGPLQDTRPDQPYEWPERETDAKKEADAGILIRLASAGEGRAKLGTGTWHAAAAAQEAPLVESISPEDEPLFLFEKGITSS